MSTKLEPAILVLSLSTPTSKPIRISSCKHKKPCTQVPRTSSVPISTLVQGINVSHHTENSILLVLTFYFARQPVNGHVDNVSYFTASSAMLCRQGGDVCDVDVYTSRDLVHVSIATADVRPRRRNDQYELLKIRAISRSVEKNLRCVRQHVLEENRNWEYI